MQLKQVAINIYQYKSKGKDYTKYYLNLNPRIFEAFFHQKMFEIGTQQPMKPCAFLMDQEMLDAFLLLNEMLMSQAKEERSIDEILNRLDISEQLLLEGLSHELERYFGSKKAKSINQ